jgi:hypothetical protein
MNCDAVARLSSIERYVSGFGQGRAIVGGLFNGQINPEVLADDLKVCQRFNGSKPDWGAEMGRVGHGAPYSSILPMVKHSFPLVVTGKTDGTLPA